MMRMKLQQLRFLNQVVASGFNVTAAAAELHTSQSGVSRQIRLLEGELGATIFIRQENRLVGLTDVGREIAEGAHDVLMRAAQLKTIAADFDASDPGELTLATTHVHARYALLPAVGRFTAQFPSTALRLIQTFPKEIFELLENDTADLGLTTESASNSARFDTIPAYSIGRCVITPVGHPLLGIDKPDLAEIARHPLVVYDNRLSSGRTVIEAFERRGITPNIVLSAVDVDVIKAYVGSGIGVAIVPTIAYEPRVDRRLRAVGLDHLFSAVMTHIVVRRGKYLRRCSRVFMELLARGSSNANNSAK
jgi:LysR family transcriptional regulator, cys regulon transcriptional activator